MNVSIATRKLLHNCHAPFSRNTFDMEKVEKNFSRDLAGINLAYFYHSADRGGEGRRRGFERGKNGIRFSLTLACNQPRKYPRLGKTISVTRFGEILQIFGNRKKN